MKCFRCCCSVLLCLVLLLGVSSLPANALELPSKKLTITEYEMVYTNAWSTVAELTFKPSDGTVQKTSDIYHLYDYIWASYKDKFKIAKVLEIKNIDGSTIAEGGIKTTIKLENVYFSYLLDRGINGYLYLKKPSYCEVKVLYDDGSIEWFDINTFTQRTDTSFLDSKLSFIPKKDVIGINFHFITMLSSSSVSNTFDYEDYIPITMYLGEYAGDLGYNLVVIQPSEEAGLLQGVIDKLTSGFSALGEKLSSLVNAIVELPAKIWEKISDGLKGLFVPDEEYLAVYKDRWSELLSDRLGAVYQVVEVTFGAWDRVTESDISDTINMPEVTIPLPEDNEFSFGGYDVKIVPDGFDILATAVKSIVGVVCTLAFINGIRKRYDEIMGVDQ